MYTHPPPRHHDRGCAPPPPPGGRKPCSEHGGCLPEIRSRKRRRIGQAEVRMVEYVECVQPRLQPQTLSHLKLATKGQIDLLQRKAAKRVATECSLTIGRRRRER